MTVEFSNGQLLTIIGTNVGLLIGFIILTKVDIAVVKTRLKTVEEQLRAIKHYFSESQRDLGHKIDKAGSQLADLNAQIKETRAIVDLSRK